MIDHIRLSKTISHALRHEPATYGLQLDEQGWVPVATLLSALRTQRKEWRDLQETDLQQMMSSASKQRYEMQDGQIRAFYGHSVPEKLDRQPAEPPELLYHGTSPETVPLIRESGLLPMNRQHVHLSVDVATATIVGRRKSRTPVILRVQARQASQHGCCFYLGHDSIWLADPIPPQFVEAEG